MEPGTLDPARRMERELSSAGGTQISAGAGHGLPVSTLGGCSLSVCGYGAGRGDLAASILGEAMAPALAVSCHPCCRVLEALLAGPARLSGEMAAARGSLCLAKPCQGGDSCALSSWLQGVLLPPCSDRPCPPGSAASSGRWQPCRLLAEMLPSPLSPGSLSPGACSQSKSCLWLFRLAPSPGSPLARQKPWCHLPFHLLPQISGTWPCLGVLLAPAYSAPAEGQVSFCPANTKMNISVRAVTGWSFLRHHPCACSLLVPLSTQRCCRKGSSQ